MIVKLRQDEIAICNILGRMRSLIARNAGVVDVKLGNQDGNDADVMGFAGEYAFSKYFNTFPDIGLVPRSGSSDGSYKGYNYDIKSTNLENGRLLCTLKENPIIDIYILAIVNFPNVNFVGYAFSKELRKEENKINLGHGEGFALTQDKLRKFKGENE